MPWSGAGVFTRTDGTRTGATVWAQAKAALIKILSTAHDTHDQDLAAGINACLAKNGENAATGNIPMGGYKLTGLAAGASAGESVRYEQVQLLDSYETLAAAGGSQGAAAAVSKQFTLATSNSPGQGIRLPALATWGNRPIYIYMGEGLPAPEAAYVYPASGEKFKTLSANAYFTATVGRAYIIFPVADTTWAAIECPTVF